MLNVMFGVFYLACGVAEIDQKPAAEVAEVVADAEPAAKPAGDGTTLSVDLAKSSIGFIGAKISDSHTGEFQSFEGSITVEDGVVVATDFSIDMTSLEADKAKLTKHLLGDDFFDVVQFPTTKFSGKVVAAANEGGPQNTTGVLTLHGVEKEISFPVTVSMDGTVVKVNSEFKINRQDFGVSYPGRPDDLIKDDVAIVLDLSFN